MTRQIAGLETTCGDVYGINGKKGYFDVVSGDQSNNHA